MRCRPGWSLAAAPRGPMCNQRPFGHTGIVQIIQPLDLKPGKFGLDAIRDGEVRHEAAAIGCHELAGQRAEGHEVIGHARSLTPPRQA